MATIHPRSSWGPKHGDGDGTALSGLAEEVRIHHTASAMLRRTASVAEEVAALLELERTGERRFGAGISYNVLVFPSGRAYQGVSFNRRGTHTGGRNSIARSVCFVGNYETHEPTAEALATAADIIADGRGVWWKRDALVGPHSDVSETACPGRNVRKHLAALADGGVPNVPSPPAPSRPSPGTPTAPAALRRGSSGARVKRLQQRLRSNYPLYAKSLAVDGHYGPHTERVVREFQRRAGLAVDGIAGPATHAALGLAY